MPQYGLVCVLSRGVTPQTESPPSGRVPVVSTASFVQFQYGVTRCVLILGVYLVAP